MPRRLHRLPQVPLAHPTQLVLGLDVGVVLLGKRSRAKGKYIGGGGFAMPAKAKAA